MSWISALSDPVAVQRIFGENPPDLNSVRLHEITLNRDGPRVTIRFDFPEFPDTAPSKWKSKGFNTIQGEITFVGVREITLQGFARDAEVDMEVTHGEGVSVSINSPELQFHLLAEAAMLSNISAYLDDATPA